MSESWPYDASQVKSIKFLDALLGNDGTAKRGELVGYSDYQLARIVPYCKALGLVQEDGEELILTQRGKKAAGLSTEEAFREGIEDYSSYSNLLEEVRGEVDSSSPKIGRKDVARLLKKYTDVAENTRRRIATTFLQTLEGAGYGEYKTGRGDSQSRFVFDQEYLESWRQSKEKASEPDKDHSKEVQDEMTENVKVEVGEVSVEVPANWDTKKLAKMIKEIKDM